MKTNLSVGQFTFPNLSVIHVPNGCYEDYLRQVDAQLRESSAVEPWFVVPAEKKWYRDYVIASIIAESFEKNAISSAAAGL